MSKVVVAKSKKCRSYKMNLWGRPNDALVRRMNRPGYDGKEKGPYPGQHPNARRYTSDYGKQNLKVQRLKAYYLLTAKKLKTLAREAASARKNPLQVLTVSLETMVYIIAYRSTFASTMFLARQLASHGHFYLNDKKITKKSIRLKKGDVLKLSPQAATMDVIRESLASGQRNIPDYLEVNKENMSVKLKRIPEPSEIPFESDINIAAAISFYSR